MARFDALKHGWFDFRRKRFWAWLLVALYTLFGFVVAPLIARSVIVDQVHKQLGLTATLDDVDINPFALSVRLEKFALADESGQRLIAFDAFIANLQLASIVNRALTFSELRLVHPFVNVVRDPGGTVNLAALIPAADPSAPPETESAPLRMIIALAAIDGGRVAIVDRDARQPYQTELGPVDLKLTDLSTLPDREGRQTLVMQTRYGGRLDWSGTLSLQPLHSAGHISLSGEQLPGLSAYLPAPLLVSIVQGTLDVAFDYELSTQADGVAAAMSNLAVKLADLALAQQADADVGADLLRLQQLAITGGRIAWPQRSVAFDRVALAQPQISFSRDTQQRFIWERLWQAGTEAASPPAAGAPPSAPETETAPTATTTAGEAPPSPPWSVQVGRFDVDAGQIRFDDRGVAPAAALGIGAVTASVDSFTLDDGAVMPFTLNFSVDSGGAVALAGTLTAFPDVRVDARSQITGLVLTPVNAYLRADTYLQLASGALRVEGHLVSNADEAFGYDGELQLTDVEVQREGEEQRFAGLKSLALTGITVSASKRKLDIARAELDSAFAKVHISKDRVLNLANVSRSDAPTPAAGAAEPAVSEAAHAAAEEAPWSIKIARLKVVDADADFTDESLPVPFHRAISSLDGSIGTLDTGSRTPTQLKLVGQVGEFGELRLSGHLNAFDPLLDTDITAAFRNVEMPGASPYAIRFAGHKVASGKLDLDLHYVLRKGMLEGQHKIILRDFELGEKVDYPEALDLPFGLAISLLKDSSGNIDIDLPVEGDVNDPTFRIGGVIMKALANLITKIATAPFSLLGRLVGFGGGEDFDAVLFEPGAAELSPPEREKVAKIAEALVLRPNLRLTLHAVTDPDADGLALRKAAVAARLDASVGDEDASGRLKIVQNMVKDAFPDAAARRAARTVQSRADIRRQARAGRDGLSERAG